MSTETKKFKPEIDQREKLEHLARKHNLVFLGIVDLEITQDFARYQKWLKEKKHADLTYLEKNLSLRENPKNLFPGATSAIILGLPYYQGDPFLMKKTAPEISSPSPQIAQYARFQDYHKFLKKQATCFIEEISLALALVSLPPQYRIFVDTAPLLEKALAAKTILGFLGKNTCYIHPKLGSFLLLSEILIQEPLALALKLKEKKIPLNVTQKLPQGGCGSCKRCQDLCPTQALSEDYRMDVKKCLSYWTIENQGPIPVEFWPWLKTYYFGCDLCQLACPWNWTAKNNTLPSTIPIRKFPTLFTTATMTQKQYEEFFGGTPLTRAKRNGLRRNALIALAETKDPKLKEAIRFIQKDSSLVLDLTIAEIEKRFSL